ncbi:MAG: VCBS repeat-containing protein, partial [Planctomycetes bacterium]|nr:VCBS repeat-containing protein [Planctomycetota bacterium]
MLVEGKGTLSGCCGRRCIWVAAYAIVASGVPASGGDPRPSTSAPESAEGEPTRIRFERLAVSSLPKFDHFNDHPRASLLPEDNGSGCAWGDYDGDGDDDLFLCNINGPYLMAPGDRRRSPGSRLWRNDGDGRFTDVTEAAGLSASRMDMGAVFADFDNDGDADLLVTSLHGVRLYQNDKGRYTDVTAKLGLGAVRNYCLGAAWGDFDRDGKLDLYICRYVDFPIDKARKRPLVAGRPAPMTTPGNYPGLANHLFHQEPDGTFRDVAAASGTLNANGRSMQAIWCDFDNDGWIDLYVANDQSLDCLFRNKQDGTFEDLALMAGVYDPRGAMGVAITDYQSDGDQDLFVTHWVAEDPAFYINNGIQNMLSFDDHATRSGLRKEDSALVGWGTDFVDFDNDADQDLFIIYGSTIEDELTLDVLKNPKMLPQKSQIYERRDNRWYPLGTQAGPYFGETHVGRGAAVCDFDS